MRFGHFSDKEIPVFTHERFAKQLAKTFHVKFK